MIKNLKTAIVGATLLTGLVVSVHSTSLNGSADYSVASPFSVESGPTPARLYATNCSSCHGRDGRGQTAKGRRLEATDLTGDWNKDQARGIRIITNGKGDMPGFKSKLTPEQIRSVFSYTLRF
jgi:mono/diheme cytochrome c family protein